MNKASLTFYILLSFALILSPTANASTVLSATDGDINFYNADNLFAGISYQLFMFDDTTSINNNLNSSDGLQITLPSVVGILGPVGNNYIATNTNGNTLQLSGSDNFVLALYDDNNHTWLEDSGITPISAANGVIVSFVDPVNLASVNILASDTMTTVPLPASIWLFLAGLISITVQASRRR